MSEAFYTRMAATASRLINKYGKEITVVRDTRTRDRVTGVETGPAPTTLTPVGLVLDYDNKQIDGTRIQAGDRLVVFTMGYSPSMVDKIQVDGDGQGWNVVSVKTKKPSTVALVHFVQVRK